MYIIESLLYTSKRSACGLRVGIIKLLWEKFFKVGPLAALLVTAPCIVQSTFNGLNGCVHIIFFQKPFILDHNVMRLNSVLRIK